MAVEIDSDDKENLANLIKSNIGNSVEFSNGCWLSLKDDDGIYWGECPYGQNWCCNSDDGFIESVIKWIAYWDEPRTETGELVELPKDLETLAEGDLSEENILKLAREFDLFKIADFLDQVDIAFHANKFTPKDSFWHELSAVLDIRMKR